MISQRTKDWVRQVVPLARLIQLRNGTYPRWLAERRLEHLARDQATFNGRICQKLAYDRDPRLILFSDKYRVREYVLSKVGESVLTRLHAVAENLSEVDPSDTPREMAIKTNHGWGASIFVSEQAKEATRLPRRVNRNNLRSVAVRPENFDWNLARTLTTGWLQLNYEWAPGRFPEWAYRGVKPVVMIEELLHDRGGGPLTDYKFFMFGGKCELIQVNTDRYGHHRQHFYDPAWRPVLALRTTTPGPPCDPPQRLPEMIEIAEHLSAEIDFVRVDLYDSEAGIKFGELTNYPWGGRAMMRPEVNRWLGSKWPTTASSEAK